LRTVHPVATQIVRQDLGLESIQEIDYGDVFKGCSVYCEMIGMPEQARCRTVAACQAALTKRGVAMLVVPGDVANAARHDELPYVVHARWPVIRPSDVDFDEIAAILNKSNVVTIYAGAGCADAHDEVAATAARLQRRWPIRLVARTFSNTTIPTMSARPVSIEPMIGHMKADGRLGRNHLLGAAGDAINALLVAAGHNLRLILNWLRLFVAWLMAALMGSSAQSDTSQVA
jgi:thiamine pyrophosphate-dependent acetolactate synthase large subunit-like protein